MPNKQRCMLFHINFQLIALVMDVHGNPKSLKIYLSLLELIAYMNIMRYLYNRDLCIYI